MSQFVSTVKRYAVPTLIATGTVLISQAANATIAEDITTAIDSGKTNVGLVAAGLVAIATIMTGLGLVISALRR